MSSTLYGSFLSFHQLLCLAAGEKESLDRQIFLDDLLHLRLDLRKNFGSEGGFGVDVIIEAVVDRRTDRQLCLGIKALHRLCKNVRCCVPEDLLALLVGKGKGLDLRAVGDLFGKTDDLSVSLSRDDLFAHLFGFLENFVCGFHFYSSVSSE